MEKPKKPIEPNCSDRIKYPTPPVGTCKNYLGQPISGANPNYVRDYHKYSKDMIQYEKDIEVYNQIKFIKIIKVAKEKYILSKYKIAKL